MEFAIEAETLLELAKTLATHAKGVGEMSRVLVTVADHNVTMMASDGYRLASIEAKRFDAGQLLHSHNRVVADNVARPAVATLDLDYKATVSALKSLKGEKKGQTNAVRVVFPAGSSSFEEITLRGESGVSAALRANVTAAEAGHVSLNRQYLLDAIVGAGAKDDGTVRVVIRGAMDAASVEGENGTGSTFLVMPVRD